MSGWNLLLIWHLFTISSIWLLRLGRQGTTFCYPKVAFVETCLLYTSPSPRDMYKSRMPSSA